MKGKINRAWACVFKWISSFFGVAVLKAVLSGDRQFFGNLPEDEDDWEDREFFLTEGLSIVFTGRTIQFPQEKENRERRRPA